MKNEMSEKKINASPEMKGKDESPGRKMKETSPDKHKVENVMEEPKTQDSPEGGNENVDSEIKKPTKKKKKKRDSKKKKISLNLFKAETYEPCVHIHFKPEYIDRECLTHDQYLEMLATPKGYRWSGEVDCNNPELEINKPRKKKSKRREDFFIRQEAGDYEEEMETIWDVATSEIMCCLTDFLVTELGMSLLEAEDFIDFLSGTVKQPPPKKKKTKPKTSKKHKWVKEYSDILAEKLEQYIGSMLTKKRTSKVKKIAEVIIERICDLTGENISMEKPRKKSHKLMVHTADRLALWIIDIMKDIDKPKKKKPVEEEEISESDLEEEQEEEKEEKPKEKKKSKKEEEEKEPEKEEEKEEEPQEEEEKQPEKEEEAPKKEEEKKPEKNEEKEQEEEKEPAKQEEPQKEEEKEQEEEEEKPAEKEKPQEEEKEQEKEEEKKEEEKKAEEEEEKTPVDEEKPEEGEEEGEEAEEGEEEGEEEEGEAEEEEAEEGPTEEEEIPEEPVEIEIPKEPTPKEDRRKLIPPPRKSPGAAFEVKPKTGSTLQVQKLSSGTVAEVTAKVRGVEIPPRGRKVPISESPLNLKSAEDWADWAENIGNIADEWGKWLESRLTDAEKQLLEKRKSDWKAWRDEAHIESLKWRVEEERIKDEAEIWSRKIDEKLKDRSETEVRTTDLS